MKDTVVNGSGTSRSLKIPASKAIVYQDIQAMVDDMVSGNFLFDLGPLRDSGLSQRGTDLNKANLLSDETAALLGLDSSAVPDDVLAVLALSAVSGKKAVIFTVKDENGAPLQGVKMLGLSDINGETPVSDQDGMCTAIISKATTVTATSSYLDTKDVTLTVSVPEKLASQVSVTIPYIEINGVREITASGSYSVSRTHNVLVCCAGGGQNGNPGSKKVDSGTGGTGGIGGTGGTGGKIANSNLTLFPGTSYDAVVASTAGETTFSSISSDNGATDTLALNDESYRNKIGGNGASGGTGGGYAANGKNGSNSSTAGGGGGGGGGGQQSGSSPSYPGGTGGTSTYGSEGANGRSSWWNSSGNYAMAGSGGKGGDGGYAGGGGGGGGGGKAGVSGREGSGGSGGTGGPGIILIKFLD